MADQSNQLVQKLWNYCNILRDDGLSYGDYVEQLTFPLFLKMADEQSRPPFNKASPIPKSFDSNIPRLLRREQNCRVSKGGGASPLVKGGVETPPAKWLRLLGQFAR